MKKIIILLLCIAAYTQVFAQNLKTIISYWDPPYNTQVSLKYTVLTSYPYGKHGTSEWFSPSGDIIEKLNYNKGELDGVQYFYLQKDGYYGSSSEGAIGIRKPMRIYTYSNGEKAGWQREYECTGRCKTKYYLREETFLGNNYKYNAYYCNGNKSIEITHNRITGTGKEIYYTETGEISGVLEYRKMNETTYTGIYKRYFEGQIQAEEAFEGCLDCWASYETVNEGSWNEWNRRYVWTKNCKVSIQRKFSNGKTTQICYSNKEVIDCPCYVNGQKKTSGDTTFYESGKIKSLGSKYEYYESGALKRNGDSLYFENGKMQTDGKNTWFENGNPNKKVLSDRTELYYESGKIKRMEMSDSSKYTDYYENGNATKIWEKTTFNNNPCEITRNYYENGNLNDLTYQDQSGRKTYSSEEDLEKNQIRQQLQNAYNDFTQTVLKELTTSFEMKGTIDFNRDENGEISFNLSLAPLDKSIDPTIKDKLESCISKTISSKSVVLPVYNNAYSFQEQISIQVVYGKEKVFVKSGKSLLSYGETESTNPQKVNTVCKNEIARKKIISDYASQKAGVYKISYRTITINDNPSEIVITQEKYKIHTVGGNILRYTGYTVALGVSLLLALAAQ